MQRILAVYFSQTGQLERIVRSVLAPLAASPGVRMDVVALEPLVPYPFPWPIGKFFGQFPECVYLDPPPIQPPDIELDAGYDLILLAYQPWFLSPSPPITAFLKSPAVAVLRGRPVVTLIGARNMWLMGQEAMRELIETAGGRFAGNIALVDPGPPFSTFITTPLWMLTGYRKGLGRWLPPAGIDEATIASARIHGEALCAGLLDGRLARGELVLDVQRSAPVDPRYIATEHIGRRSFRIWGRLVRAAGPPNSWRRTPVLWLYSLFLIFAIVAIVPLTLVARKVFSLFPAYRARLERQVRYFERP